MGTPLNSKRPTNIRTTAYQVLEEWSKSNLFAKNLLHHKFDQHEFTTREKAFLTELVYGVIRQRITLDHLIKIFSQRSLEHLQAGLLNALRIGVYQLLFLEKVPPSAAVNESVELVKRRFGKKAAGFVNAILRSMNRELLWISAEEVVDQRYSLLCHSSRIARFSRPLFPEIEEDPIGYLNATRSHPRWLLKRWISRFGVKETEKICLANNRPVPVHIRWRGKETPPKDFEPTEFSDQMYSINSVGDPSNLPGFKEGEFIIQGLASFLSVQLLKIEPGIDILDLCAAPGTKTIYLSDLTGRSGKVYAMDKSLSRIRRVRDPIQRLNIHNIHTVVSDSTQIGSWLRRRFNRIIIDAPCSNTGELSRRVDVRHRLKPEDIQALSALQTKLLSSAIQLLTPGGILLYCTCSLEEEEGPEVIRKLLLSSPNYKKEEEKWFFPHTHGGVGGYAASIKLKGCSIKS